MIPCAVEYLTQFTRELFENTQVHCRFQIAEDLPEVPLPPEMRHNLFLVVKEALTNSLKHSRATEISLSATTRGSQMEICCRGGNKRGRLRVQKGTGEMIFLAPLLGRGFEEA